MGLNRVPPAPGSGRADSAKEPECRNGQGCLFLHWTGCVRQCARGQGGKNSQSQTSIASVFG
eukprot:1068486-Prymnesium_polylepis.1